MGHEDEIDEKTTSEFSVYNQTLEIFRAQN
jgi:hypothetical protein